MSYIYAMSQMTANHDFVIIESGAVTTMIPIGTVYAVICRTTAEATSAIEAEANRDGAIIGPVELIRDDDGRLCGGSATVTGQRVQ